MPFESSAVNSVIARQHRADRHGSLKTLLDAFLVASPFLQRLPFDPVELPRQYQKPRDIEVAALLSASLAYGRADLFKPKVAALLASMGSSPAEFVTGAGIADLKRLLDGFVYRFNVGSDLAVLLTGMGKAINGHGSLENLYVAGIAQAQNNHQALSAFVQALRSVRLAPIRKALGPERGLNHLLPNPLGPGAAKRLNLFLRWMVRGPDQIDLGIWKTVPPAGLIIPLDVHVGRIARYLRLTRRNDLSWKTALEITESLRKLDPSDPTKYDFALCHYGMSGICPATPVVENCARCLLSPVCTVGRRRRLRVAGS